MSEFEELSPLRKETATGGTQVRRKRTIEQIQRAKAQGYAELLERAKITDRASADYVVSEVLIFMMREAKSHNNRALFDKLFLVIWQRVQRSFSWFRPGQDLKADVDQLQMEELVMDNLGRLISQDQADYDEDLDYYEVSFDQALKYDRIDAWRSVMGRASRRAPMTTGDEEERITLEVKSALSAMAVREFTESEEKIYRLEVFEAIKQLPDKEREVMLYTLRDIPVEANDPNTPSISSLLQCAPETVRYRRRSARAKLKQILGEEE